MNAKALSQVLKEVGVNRKGQNYVLKGLTSEDKCLIYDLSAIFTGSEAIKVQVVFCYPNKKKQYAIQ
jgi:hypothetical protein